MSESVDSEPVVNNRDLTKALTMLWESAAQMPHDLGGDQREWHLPRITKATAILSKMFPQEAGNALQRAKTPYGDNLAE